MCEALGSIISATNYKQIEIYTLEYNILEKILDCLRAELYILC